MLNKEEFFGQSNQSFPENANIRHFQFILDACYHIKLWKSLMSKYFSFWAHASFTPILETIRTFFKKCDLFLFLLRLLSPKLMEKIDKGNKPENLVERVLQMDIWANRQTELNSRDPPAVLGAQNEKNGWVNYHGRYNHKFLHTERNECFDSAVLRIKISEAL